jgi:hypothetical protein
VTGLPFDDPHSPTTACPSCGGVDPHCAHCRGLGKVYVPSVPREEQFPEWTDES